MRQTVEPGDKTARSARGAASRDPRAA